MKPEREHFGWWDSVACAMVGWKALIRYERNFRIHLVIAVLVSLAGWVFSIALWEWAFIIVMIGLMLTTEALNTAIERVVDLACDNKPHPVAGLAKDIAAGACLIMALTAAVLGAVIFAPKLFAMFVTK